MAGRALVAVNAEAKAFSQSPLNRTCNLRIADKLAMKECTTCLQDIFPGRYVVKAQIGKHRSLGTCRLLIEANGLLIGSHIAKWSRSRHSSVQDDWQWKEDILASCTLRGTSSIDVTIRMHNVESTVKQGLALEMLSLERVFYHTRGPYNEL